MNRSRLFTILLFAGLLALALCACRDEDGSAGGSATSPPRRVVLISIDTLRADRLGCYGYERPTSPNIDALATRGARFEHAQVHRGSTWPSLTSLLTGKYPVTHGVRKNAEMLSADHLFLSEMLESHGFETAAFLANMTRAPNRGFGTKVVYNDPALSQADWDRAATEDALAWVEEHRDDPFFLWVHYMDPHKPYTPEPEFDRFSAGLSFEVPEDFERPDRSARKAARGDRSELDEYLQYVMGRGVDLSEEEVAYVDALYDGEITAVDHEVGRLLEGLSRLGLDDETLLVLTSDHGEELYDRNHYFYHAASVYEGVLRVPLVVRWPGVVEPGRVIDTLVESVDIVPTALDALGLEPESGVEGVSLVPLLRGDGERPRDTALAEWAEKMSLKERRPIYTVRRGRYKLIHNPDDVDPDIPPFKSYGTVFPIDKLELYDLRSDPLEQRNLAAAEPEKVAELLRVLGAFVATHGDGGDAVMSMESIIEAVILGYQLEDEARKYAEKAFGVSAAEFDEALRRARGER